MDPNFAFPAPSKPTLRPAASQPTEPIHRESNALRASVLDAALQLGFGSNNTVANWMFSNTLEEEEEEPDEDAVKDPLSATSEEYAPYSTPPTSTSEHSETFYPSDRQAVPQVHFPASPAIPAPTPSSSNKLRKPRPDGYESDGGYVSDGGKKVRARTKSKTKKDAAAAAISDPMELLPMSKEEMKRMKKAAKHSKDHDASLETDAEDSGKKAKKPKKSKKSSTDAGAAGYETDDGYVSSSGKPKKGRSRFFSLRKKSDSASEPIVEPVPPMPEREVFPLPIALRFATTIGSDGATSRSESPLMPPSRPFVSTSGSSTPSLSSSATSLLTSSDRESFGTGSLSMTAELTRTESYNSGHTPDTSLNSILTATDSVVSRAVSPQTASPKSKVLISYPITRTASAESQNQSPSDSNPPKPTRHIPSPISLAPPELNSRAPSPSPIAGSPFVVLTPLNSAPPRRAISPAPSSIIIPSSDFLVPSRSASPLPPSPNVMAYYDIPPPSPPPNGPLPRAPRAPPSANRDIQPGVSRLRSLSQDRGGRQAGSSTPISGRVSPNPGRASPNPGGAMSPLSPGERGRAAPFPSRPVLQSRAGHPSMGPGLAARAKVQRYRDLYAIQIPGTPAGARGDDGEGVDIRVEDYDEGEVDEEGREEIIGVIGRFRDRPRDERTGRALERNDSGVLRPGAAGGRDRLSPSSPGFSPGSRVRFSDYEDDDQSRYPDEDKTAGYSTMYRYEGGRDTDTMYTGRETMYSEYSRASFLDVDKSDKARTQLVDRVGSMFDLSGRERSAIPPVPKLPAALAAGAVGNRF
ncbi:hypothetical protein FB45DRAFT_997532 [Roridomyces roridus]|uniref:Uncharacterized protein n=1 Tax=Roridomyces roridus TaxID=1738132 RepID=A0AAD7CJS8_9AGAR|nr:hypothetical protein FB45DRAFT_997532 [Roridomyces roridus]